LEHRADLARVKFTNLEKILYPRIGVTKKQVIDYYIQTAPLMLDFLQDRAVTMYRFPDGIDKEGFYEKDAPKGKPFWVRTFRRYSETANRDVEFVVCNDVETLAWLVNLATLEINISLARVHSYEKPDLVLFDIDPEPPADIEDAIHVALLLKEKLDLLGMESYVKTTGKKGLHIVVPIVPNYTFKQTRAFVHQMGKLLAKESPLVVSEFSQSRESGTVFIDYTQNTHFKTMICPYSLRVNEQATVSVPLEWREVEKGVKPSEFNIFSVLKRETNPWEELFRQRQTLDFENLFEEKVEPSTPPNRESTYAETQENVQTALKEYIQKRDLARTGEPSGGTVLKDVGRIFVVQEHRARKLHYDLRLAREGVLKSWAVPKGIPDKSGTRRLAVQTEDHPLEYSEFEGTIPEGHYGAGTVKARDRGTYELKIWTEDKIEFFLKGKKLHGPYVLVRLKKPTLKRQKQEEWLLIRLKDQNDST